MTDTTHMTSIQRPPWGAVLMVAGILAGCGGGGSDSEHEWQSTTSTPSGIISGGPVIIRAGGDNADEAILPENYHLHDMQGFSGRWYQSYANAALKLLISGLGPKKLLDHLENFKNGTHSADERAAATQFIALIHQAHTPYSSVDTTAFIDGLQNLAPFNKRNAAGKLEFKFEADGFPQERDPEQFLALFSELFRLDTLPGWGVDVLETYHRPGEQKTQQAAKNRFEMFLPINLARVTAEQATGITLQKVLDLLQADEETQLPWNEGDAAKTSVRVSRQISIPDVEHLERLSISLRGAAPKALTLSLEAPVTLTAVNAKTQQKILLTLTPEADISQVDKRYHVHIKTRSGRWMAHDDVIVRPVDASENDEQVKLINFAVTRIAPAP